MFTELAPLRYECNGCRIRYVGEKLLVVYDCAFSCGAEVNKPDVPCAVCMRDYGLGGWGDDKRKAGAR